MFLKKSLFFFFEQCFQLVGLGVSRFIFNFVEDKRHLGKAFKQA